MRKVSTAEPNSVQTQLRNPSTGLRNVSAAEPNSVQSQLRNPSTGLRKVSTAEPNSVQTQLRKANTGLRKVSTAAPNSVQIHRRKSISGLSRSKPARMPAGLIPVTVVPVSAPNSASMNPLRPWNAESNALLAPTPMDSAKEISPETSGLEFRPLITSPSVVVMVLRLMLLPVPQVSRFHNSSISDWMALVI